MTRFNRLNAIITIIVIALSGYIGFMTNYVNSTKATNSPPLVITDVPKPTGFSFNIDLNSNKVVANTLPKSGISVDITKRDSIVYVPKYVNKIKLVRVTEQPPVRRKKSVVRIPMSEQKIRVGVSNNTQRDS